MSKAMWGGRFSKSTDEMINEFQASINFDKRMYHEDIAGSIAHATMLAKCGIITDEDRDKIVAGLKDILQKIEEGNFEFSVDLEDIHMNIEKRLTDAIGEAGGRLHTARSRNDQVALDTHMYVRREIVAVQKEIENLQRALVETAEKYSDVIMPGYTHLQRAQPILFSHHLLAYFGMLSRDFARFEGVYKRADIMPLGAGALAGTTFPIDREFVQKQLNFENIYTNSLAVYAQLIRGMKVRKDVMKKAVTEDFSNATDLADYLVKKGMPFRKAHAVSGQAVHDCIEKGIYLEDMSLEDFQKLSPLFGADIKEAISPETCVKNRNSLGGTSYKQVELQLSAAKDLLAAEEKVSDKAADKQIQVK